MFFTIVEARPLMGYLSQKTEESIGGPSCDKCMLGRDTWEGDIPGDTTPLLRAVELGRESLVMMLLGKGANPEF